MDWFLFIVLFILGACLGSFINVVLYRQPRGDSPFRGRSRCPSCKHVLAWRDLIPLASFALLSGRCRYCRARIFLRYPAVELAVGLLFALSAIVLPATPARIVYLAAASFFTVLFIYDWAMYLVPDKISVPAAAVILFLNIVLFGRPLFFLLGAAAGGAWFLWQFLISRGRWVGGGDIRLGFLMGALLGWPQVLLALMLSYIGGSILALGLIVFGKKTLKSRLPFATILLPSALIVFLWGGGLWRWYMGIVGL